MKEMGTIFLGAIVFLALVAVVMTIGAVVWKYAFWPIFFEQWLGPIPWRGAFGVAFVMAAISARAPKGKS